MSKAQASDRIYRRLDDLQASLGDVMTRVNCLEEAARTECDIGQDHRDAIKLHGTLIKELTKRVEALERNDG